MKNNMKNNLKGFIQIPILIAIILGILFVGGMGYIGVKRYQTYQAEKVEKARVAQEREKEAQVLTEEQKKALEKAQLEIEKLKEESAESKKRQEVLEQKIQNEQKSNLQNFSISAVELEPYLTGVQSVSCYDSMGSGSLWFLDQTYLVLTNKHVVGLGHCEMDFENKDRKTTGFYGLDTQKMYSINPETDSTFIPIKLDPSINPHVVSAPLSTLNYKISSLRKCQSKMAIGSPVVLVGYPIYGRKVVDDSGGWVGYKVTTDGIISGYDDFLSGKYGNYFVSAKIDSGNSGGIAFSKNENGLCILGIPTWLTIGNYETQGIVQNINNVIYIK